MYRILVVDDEAIERNGILFLIQKYNLPLQTAQAENGETALQYLQGQTVDILLTDIKMPFMDGLQLSKKALQLQPDLKIIIFSAYGDFQYAKTAIAIGVADYILKPINISEFKAVMGKVLNEINLDRENKEKERELLDGYNKSVRYEDEYILLNLINGVPMDKLLHGGRELVNVNFLKAYTRMIFIEFEPPFFEDFNASFGTEFKQILQCNYDYLNLNQYQCVLFLKDYHKASAEVKALGMALYRYISEKYRYPVYIILGNYLKKPEQIPGDFSNFEQILEYRFFVNDTHVFVAGMDYSEQDNEPELIAGLLENAKFYIRMKDLYSLSKCVRMLCKSYQRKTDFSHLYIKFVFSELLKTIFDQSEAFNESALNGAVEKIYKSNNLKQIETVMNESMEKLKDSLPKIYLAGSKEVNSIKEYIYNHYDEQLSLESLAQKVFLTPSYLSHIFKKETGSSLIKFIKAFRMEKAKEQLENSNIRIVNICKNVGYSNVSYFCQSFREFYGVSPEKFRQKDEKA